MLNKMGFTKSQSVFFAVLLFLFAVPTLRFEMAGIMTAEARWILGSMILLLAYGLIRSLTGSKPVRRLERVEFAEPRAAKL